MKIGFFDSGLGGLTILRAVRAHMPQYDYVYFGDTAHLPYGDKSESEVCALTEHAIRRLFDAGALLVVIACNTASAETLRTLQDRMLVGKYADRRILGVIVPTVEVLIASGLKKVLLIGTKRTVHSGKYERELEKRGAFEVELTTCATPELVPLIEANDMDEAYAYIDALLTPWVGEIEGVVLGCTHYTTLAGHIRERFGAALMVISQDEIIPEKLHAYLDRHAEIESRLTQNGTLDVMLSKESAQYDRITASLLNWRE